MCICAITVVSASSGSGAFGVVGASSGSGAFGVAGASGVVDAFDVVGASSVYILIPLVWLLPLVCVLVLFLEF